MERRIVTILFADLVGFTPLSERLDAEDVGTIQDAYFEAVRATVGCYGGQVEKFIGDAAMAVFGLARTRDDDAERAVRAGLGLVNAVETLAGRLGLEAGDLRIRVGVNTGEVVASDGMPGAPRATSGDAGGSFQGRVTGDAVNTAARLQAAAPAGRVMLGETTALAVAESIELEEIEPVVLKGKAEPVRASLAVMVRPVRSRELAMGSLRAPLVGRSGELAGLEQVAARSAAGDPGRLLLVAPPGVGKSRLVAEFLARQAGFHILRARLRPEAASPFDAIIELLSNALGNNLLDRELLLGILDQAGVPAGRAVVVVDEVVRLMNPPADRLGQRADRDALFDAWATMLDATATDRPALWLIEDLHWAELDLLGFLDVANQRGRPGGRLIVATGRPAVLERVRTTTDRDHRQDWLRIELETLAPGGTADLLTALVGSALPDELVVRIVAASDGNPLFIEELLRTWASVGVLVRSPDSGAWRLAVAAHEAALPATVQAIYAAQLDDLPAGPRTAARRASVAGRRFPVAALGSLDVAEVAGALATLERRALVGPVDPDPISGPAYGYRHALLRDAGYASLSRAERARLHVRLARWLEERAGDRRLDVAELVGNHFAAALESTPALATEVGDGLDRRSTAALAADRLERAGGLAQARDASEAARLLFLRSLELSADAADLDSARRLARLAEATARAADLDAAADLFERASERYRTVLDTAAGGSPDATLARRGYAAAVAGRSALRYEQLRFAEARAIAETGLAATGDADPHAAVPLRLARLSALEGLTNDYSALLAQARDVARTALDTADPDLIFEARRSVLGLGHAADRVRPAEWLEFSKEAARLGRWGPAASALGNAASLLTSPADRGQVRSLLARAEAISEARNLTEQQAWIHQSRCELELETGDWAVARFEGLRALELADLKHYDRVAVRTWFALTPIAAATADEALLRRAAAWFQGHAGTFPASPYGSVMGSAVELRLAAHGLADAPELDPAILLDAVGLAENAASWLAAIEQIIGAWLDRGMTDVAAQAAGRYQAVEFGSVSPLVTASRALVTAMVARVGPSAIDAQAAARTAVELARLAEAAWWLDRARGLRTPRES